MLKGKTIWNDSSKEGARRGVSGTPEGRVDVFERSTWEAGRGFSCWRKAERVVSYHAGEGFWEGTKRLNAASIGIELVYPEPRVTPDRVYWPDYPQPQIEALIQLLKKLVTEYGIKDGRIVGHGEVAAGRKMDPGPRFPWFRLAEARLMKWPNADVVAGRRQEFEKNLPDMGWFQARLASLGYLVQNNCELDALTRSVIVALQMKYRSIKFDGTPDAEAGAILDVLTRPEMSGGQGKDDRAVLDNL